jgi:hypothetical protein
LVSHVYWELMEREGRIAAVRSLVAEGVTKINWLQVAGLVSPRGQVGVEELNEQLDQH